VVVGDINTPLSSIDRSTKQKLNKDIQDLKYAIDQMDLVDVYRTFHPTSTQYTFFSEAHETCLKIDHILGHKASLSKYKKIEMIPCILSDHNAVKVELNNKSKDKKYANSWKINNSLLNEEWIIDEIKEEIKKDAGKKEPSYTVGGNVNYYNHSGKKFGGYLKNLTLIYNLIQQYHSWGYTQKTVTQVTPEAPAHPCLLRHYSQ
jgi:hypothetical protein